ncbi:hypothetical protein Scep_024580 [Stephania cephalantha]|uniref:Uncharacterized protein n=1 Tax=Stephania cephalantha TaxID=152367 RepID=A0AAP0EZJ9_9MAGN
MQESGPCDRMVAVEASALQTRDGRLQQWQMRQKVAAQQRSAISRGAAPARDLTRQRRRSRGRGYDRVDGSGSSADWPQRRSELDGQTRRTTAPASKRRLRRGGGLGSGCDGA